MKDLRKVGVVNQTTMLAGETETITKFFRTVFEDRLGSEETRIRIADTKDTLCYATSENQAAIQSLVASGGDLAIVIGGYNSSNSTHLAKLCAEVVPTYYIKDATEIVSDECINHFDIAKGDVVSSRGWLPQGDKTSILISAGASSPDALVDQVIEKVCEISGVFSLLNPAVSSYIEVSA